MKKHIVSTILLVCFGVVLTGCGKNVDSLTKIDVSENTTMIMKDGTMQFAVVEGFDQDHYDESELETFINDIVTNYTKVKGEDTVKLESLSVKNQNATAKFSYKSTEDYSTFEERECVVLSTEEALSDVKVADMLVSVESGEEVVKTEALTGKKQIIAVIAANEDAVRVEGKVVYYSNAELEDENTVKTGSEGYTVLVFEV